MKKVLSILILVCLFNRPAIAENQMVEWGSHIPWWYDHLISQSNLSDLSLNSNWALGLREDGSLVAFGDNTYGVTNVPSGNQWSKISAGWTHGMAVDTNGNLIEWGQPFANTVTLSAWTNSWPANMATNTIIQVAGADAHSAALGADGTVYLWGWRSEATNQNETITTARTIASSWYWTSAGLFDGTVTAVGAVSDVDHYYEPPALTNIASVHAGTFLGYAIESNGTLHAWGTTPNTYGETTIPAECTNVVSVSGGQYHTVAVRADGTVFSFGRNNNNQTNHPPNLTNAWLAACGSYVSAVIVSNSYPTPANTHYVAPGGLNINPGTYLLPWTVSKAFSSTGSGAGTHTYFHPATNYNQSVLSGKSGTTGSKITFDGMGGAEIGSILLMHSNIVLQNFRLAGPTNVGYRLNMFKGGHHNVISNNVIDGAYSVSGPLIKWESPNPSTEAPFGGNLASGALVISNTLMRAISEGNGVVMFGDTNTFVGNYCRDYDSADWLYLWGRTNRIIGNIFTNAFVDAGTGHPDMVQSFGQNNAGGVGILIESNLFIQAPGDMQICMFEGQDCEDLHDWTFRNNLFVRIGSKGTMAFRDVKWYNNTFIECATNTAAAPYTLLFTTVTNATYTNFSASTGHGGQVLNNAFINCGDGQLDKGYYYFYTYLTNVTADYNFSCRPDYLSFATNTMEQSVGDPGGWDPTLWWEDNGINGGNPLFVDEDSLDFRPQTGSPLLGAGQDLSATFTTDYIGVTRSAWSIGAYEEGVALSFHPIHGPRHAPSVRRGRSPFGR